MWGGVQLWRIIHFCAVMQARHSLCDLCVIWIVQGRFSRKMYFGLSNGLVQKVYSSGICTGLIQLSLLQYILIDLCFYTFLFICHFKLQTELTVYQATFLHIFEIQLSRNTYLILKQLSCRDYREAVTPWLWDKT